MQRVSIRAAWAWRGLALLLVLSGQPLDAQSASGSARAEKKGRFRLGPLWLTPKILLKSAGNDNNVFNDAEQPVSDRSAVFQPSTEALLPLGKRARLIGQGAVGFNYFQRQSEERSTDLSGSLRGELDVGPLTFFAAAAGGRHKQRFSVEVDQRLERTDSSFNAGADLRLTGRVRLTTAMTGGRFRYQSGVTVQGQDVKTSLDRDNRLWSATLGYALSKRTSLELSGERIEDTFLDTAPGREDTVRSYRLSGGFAFAVGALFTGQARAGWRHFPESASALVPAFDGLALGVNLGMPVGRLGNLQLLASRDVSYAVARVPGPDGPRRNSFVASRFGGTLNTELPLSLIVRPGLYFDRADYILPHVQGGLPFDRKDRVRTVSVALLRAFGQSLRVGGTIEWARRESDLNGFDYKRRAYGLTAEYTP